MHSTVLETCSESFLLFWLDRLRSRRRQPPPGLTDLRSRTVRTFQSYSNATENTMTSSNAWLIRTYICRFSTHTDGTSSCGGTKLLVRQNLSRKNLDANKFCDIPAILNLNADNQCDWPEHVRTNPLKSQFCCYWHVHVSTTKCFVPRS